MDPRARYCVGVIVQYVKDIEYLFTTHYMFAQPPQEATGMYKEVVFLEVSERHCGVQGMSKVEIYAI